MQKKFAGLLFLFIFLGSTSTEVFKVAMVHSDNDGILVDGSAEDWEGVEPILQDPINDMKYASDPGSDIKSVYYLKERNYLYLMIDFYGSANQSNCIDLSFNKKPEGGIHFMFGVGGFQMSWPRDWKNEGVIVGYDEVAEAAFPIDILGDVPALFVAAHAYIKSSDKWDDNLGQWIPLWIDKNKGIEISYSLKTHIKSRLLEVVSNMTNLNYYKEANPIFAFNSHWHYSTQENYLLNLTFESKQDKVSYENLTKDVWKLSLEETPEFLQAHYYLNITKIPANSNYFGKDFTVFYAGSIFLYPKLYQGKANLINKIKINIHESGNWITSTVWKKENDSYICNNLEYIKNGFIAIGKYVTYEKNINGTNLMIALHHNKTLLPKSELLNYTIESFKYQKDFLEYPFHDINNFLVIFAPPPSDCNTAGFCGPSCTIDSMNELRHMWVLPHEMYHILDGISGGRLEEGITQYFGYKTSYHAGFWDIDDFYGVLSTYGAEGLKYYYKQIWNTKYNLPILSETLTKKLQENSGEWRYGFITARKPAIVSYMLNREIQKMTNGQRSFNDVISYLNKKYSDPHHFVTPEEFLETVNRVSGSDFTSFFEKYIYGDERLPPVPVKDWLDHYITMAERRVSSAEVEDKTGLESKITSMKNQKEKIIQKIYDGDYELAFTELEETIESFKETLEKLSDKTPPTIKEISYESEGDEASTNVTVRAQCSDYGCGLFSVYCCYSVNKGKLRKEEMTYSKGKHELTIPGLVEGDQIKFYIRAKDRMGNEKQSREHTYNIPGEPPEIEGFEIQPANPSPGEKVKVKAVITDEGKGVNNANLFYSVTGEEDEKMLKMDRSGSNFSASIPESEAGKIIRYYIATTDKAGNTTNSTTQSYTVKTQLSAWLSSPLTIGIIGSITALFIVIILKKMRI